jgi:signal transduction histidine kinase
VFLNLILNASDAINGTGTITVDAIDGKDSIMVNVADDGIGIPEENLARIFDLSIPPKGRSVPGSDCRSYARSWRASGAALPLRIGRRAGPC